MLEVKHISWTTPDGGQVLRDVSLTVPDGGLTVITGPNGGGKTTLAKVIAGLERPDSGEIFLDGAPISALDVTERARAGISFAFQQPVRFKGFTVKHLLELAAGKELTEKQVCYLLSRVGLCGKEYMDRQADASLSGGESKRIEIAGVLARQSKLSVFDEPEAGIDLWSFQNLIRVFEEERERRRGTLLIISHQERILRIADEIVVIAQGMVQRQGAAEKLLPELVGSGGSCPGCGKREADFR